MIASATVETKLHSIYYIPVSGGILHPDIVTKGKLTVQLLVIADAFYTVGSIEISPVGNGSHHVCHLQRHQRKFCLANTKRHDGIGTPGVFTEHFVIVT